MSLDSVLARWGAGRRWLLRRRLPLDAPFTLNVEPTDRCDCACVMCPRSKDSKEDLSWETYCSAIEQAASWGGVERLYLHKFGEPLLHPQIASMVSFAKQAKAARRVVLTTNGRTLSAELSEELCGAGLDELRVSIDAHTEASYARVKGVGGLDRVRENVKRFLDVRKRIQRRRPLLVVKMLPLRETVSEVEAFRDYWTGVADRVAIEGLIQYGERWRVIDPNPDRPGARYPCTFLWYTLAVNADATVSICCADWQKTGVVGSVEKGLLRAWRGPSLRAIRKRHLEGDFDFEPCRDCGYWRFREDIGTWLRSQGDKVL